MKSRGFTIVELLIVIVVIAILAAISIVAYNGIQQRAKNNQTITSLNAYAKALKSYYAINQNLQGTTGCYGKAGTTCGNVTDNTAACSSIGQANYEAGFGDAIKTVMSTIPEPSNQEITCGGAKYRGVLYVNFGYAMAVYSFLKGVTQCPVISGSEIYDTTGVSKPFGDGYLCAYVVSGA